MKNKIALSLPLLLLLGCVSKDLTVIQTEQGTEEDADKLLVVDCLLPGQIKRLGQGLTYVTPRRPAKLTALDCEARGGEYVAYDQANSATALKVWLPAAQEGDKVAQTYVGEIYEKGFGIQPDYKTAAQWYQRAAEQGYARAKLNLGYLFEKGLGVKQDLAMALRLYRDASGLEDTNLEFVASVDVDSSGTEAKELQQLKTSLEQEKQKAETVRKQMEAVKTQLETQRQELEKQSNELDTKRKKLAQQEKSSTSNKVQVTKLSQQLKNREIELEKRRQDVLQLKSKLDNYNKEMVTLEKQQPKVAIAGPSIQLASPQLVNLRGTPTITITTKEKTREIVGNVSAPAGLQKLSVNEKQEKVDEHGMFRALLPISSNQTPVHIVAIDQQGKQADIEFVFVQSKEIKHESIQAPILSGIKPDNIKSDLGHFHALIIGNNNYTHYPKLNTAINDAKSVAEVLSQKYGFKTTTLINANRFMILAALNRLSKKLTDKDNLLIYYAGHGELDKKQVLGYWLPVDADKQNKRKWIPNTAITDIINAMPVKRVLVVADSCYSGALTRSSLAQLDADVSNTERLTWLKAVAKSRARLALTSGGLQPVADSGANNHSLFANIFLNVLNKNSGILEGQRLYKEVYTQVSFNPVATEIGQVPGYAPIRHAGHESGEFFFLPFKRG